MIGRTLKPLRYQILHYNTPKKGPKDRPNPYTGAGILVAQLLHKSRFFRQEMQPKQSAKILLSVSLFSKILLSDRLSKY